MLKVTMIFAETGEILTRKFIHVPTINSMLVGSIYCHDRNGGFIKYKAGKNFVDKARQQ
jgi:hypothetical protein